MSSGKTEKIYGINGPVIYLKGKTDFKMSEMVHVGEEKLVGEVIPWIRTGRRYRCMRRLPDCIRENLWKVRERQCRLRWHPVS